MMTTTSPATTSPATSNPAITDKPQPLPVDQLEDIQGLIVRGYNMAAVRHFVLTIGDTTAALAFIAEITSGDGALTVTSAERWPAGHKPDYALNIGFSATGIQALKLPAAVNFGTFPAGNFASFLKGAVAQAANVGDEGTNAPEHWVDKLNSDNAADAHILLSLYSHSADERDTHSTTLRSMFAALIPESGPAAAVFELDVDLLTVTLPDKRVMNKIHFGYTDGISNPKIAVAGDPPARPNQLPFEMPWRFIMRDDALHYTPPGPSEFGINGTFSAFRILEQDVAAFDAFLAADERTPEEQEYLASKLCGRWRNGNPVVTRPDSAGEVLSNDELVDFDYGHDEVGMPCPYSAHTRRSNPRGSANVSGVKPGDKSMARIMRRANPYGPAWTGTPDGQSRGLAGHFMCASIENQFEFIMGSWVNGTIFSKSPISIDPLLGHIPKPVDFPYHDDASDPVKVEGLGQFVTTRGGLYCFLPSLTSLQWMVTNGNSGDPWRLPT